MERREFLRLAALGAAGMATTGALQACARKPDAPKLDPSSIQGLINARKKAGAREGLDVFQAGNDYVAGLPNYLGFGLGRRGELVSGASAAIWLVSSGDPKAAAMRAGPLPAPWHSYSAPESGGPQGVYAAEFRFDRPGIWTLVVDAIHSDAELVGTAAYQVRPKGKTATKIAGEKAIPSQTPTVVDHRGVDPICTRQPPCPMHEVSLADALGTGKPVAFNVGTPAFCTSRTCGPNLDELIAVRKEVGDRAIFVHAEVYKDNKPETIARQGVSPTFAEWGMESEPWLFLIDRGGMIASRFEGPLTAGQIGPALGRLLA